MFQQFQCIRQMDLEDQVEKKENPTFQPLKIEPLLDLQLDHVIAPHVFARLHRLRLVEQA